MTKTTNITKWNISPGNPLKLGVSVEGNSVNFCVAAKDSTCCFLLLYTKGSQQVAKRIEYTPQMRFGDVYAMRIEEFPYERYEYNFELDKKVITDPRAASLIGRNVWGKPEKGILKGEIIADEFSWEDDVKLDIPFEDSLIYKLHVRGFTKHSSSCVKHRGTFAGLAEKIPYLQQLGVTMIELMPIYEFNEIITVEERIVGEPVYSKLPIVNSDSLEHSSNASREENKKKDTKGVKLNYWGYGDGNYFAPKRSYAANKKNPSLELKECIKQMHQAGIEVCMEFYFVPGSNPVDIVDCLRHWVLEYHIDGVHVNLEVAPCDILKQDPILARTKMLGANWNMPPENYYNNAYKKKYLACVGDDFMIHARRFLKSDEDQLGPMSFQMRNNPSGYAVINYVANHNSLTMMDTVSYDRKHNEINGENNQDGMIYNYSWNCGVEGKTRKRKIQQMRIKQLKNLFLFLMMSQGTPMIWAGDEMGHTQLGNNNPYCQDNEISWLNWHDIDKNREIYEFFLYLVAFRKEHRILHMPQELRIMDYRALGCPDLSYHSTRAWYTDFSQVFLRHMGVMFGGDYAVNQEANKKNSDKELEPYRDSEKQNMGEGGSERNIYVAFNMYWEPQELGIPHPKKGYLWHRIVDTCIPAKEWEAAGDLMMEEGKRQVLVGPRSVQIYVEKKKILSKKKSKEVYKTD